MILLSKSALIPGSNGFRWYLEYSRVGYRRHMVSIYTINSPNPVVISSTVRLVDRRTCALPCSLCKNGYA